MATSKLNPLQHNVQIANSDGTPTPYMIQLFQQLLEEKEATDNQVETTSGLNIIAGDGLLGGGPLVGPGDIQLDADVQAILDQITNTHGAILYRDSGLWAALDPGASGLFLKTNGAAADPSWAAPSVGSLLEAGITKPTASQFSLQNAGTSTIGDISSGVSQNVPIPAAAGFRFAKWNTALPAAPYTVTARRVIATPYASTQNYYACLIIRNSANSRMAIFGTYNDDDCVFQNWASYTGFNSDIVAPFALSNKFWQWNWIRITVSATQFTPAFSNDGIQWWSFATTNIATYLGAVNEVGFGAWSSPTGNQSLAVWQSFTVA